MTSQLLAAIVDIVVIDHMVPLEQFDDGRFLATGPELELLVLATRAVVVATVGHLDAGGGDPYKAERIEVSFSSRPKHIGIQEALRKDLFLSPATALSPRHCNRAKFPCFSLWLPRPRPASQGRGKAWLIGMHGIYVPLYRQYVV